jgi:KDO2-lipid IV(A) lauroyltransferase
MIKYLKLIRNNLFFLLSKLFAFINHFIPLKSANKFGAILAAIVYLFIKKKYVSTAISNLKLIYPEKSNSEIRKLTFKVFLNQGKNLFEVLQFYKLNKENIKNYVKIVGKEYLDSALKKNKGVLYIASHFGNWELMGVALSLYGYKLNVVARKVNFDKLDNMILDIRTSKGLKIFQRNEKDTVRKILTALHKNEIVALLIDQNIKSIPGIYVNFFNHKAYSPIGLALLALKTSAPVIAGYIVREKDATHTLTILPEIEIIRTGNHQEDVKLNTQHFNDIIESYIRKYPEQWVWIHERWS